MKKAFVFLAMAALVATGCASSDQNGEAQPTPAQSNKPPWPPPSPNTMNNPPPSIVPPPGSAR